MTNYRAAPHWPNWFHRLAVKTREEQIWLLEGTYKADDANRIVDDRSEIRGI